MSDLVLVAIVTALGGIVVAGITAIVPKLNRIEASAKEAQEQTTNDHVYRDVDGRAILDRQGNTIPLNMRTEITSNHEDVMNAVNMVAQQVVSLGTTQAVHTQQLNAVVLLTAAHTGQIADIEDTLTREQVREIINNV